MSGILNKLRHHNNNTTTGAPIAGQPGYIAGQPGLVQQTTSIQQTQLQPGMAGYQQGMQQQGLGYQQGIQQPLISQQTVVEYVPRLFFISCISYGFTSCINVN